MMQVERMPDRAAALAAGDGLSRDGRRLRVERLLQRAEFLDGADRFLLRQVYEYGLGVRDIARQAGRSAQSTYRLVRKLVAHLDSPRFKAAAAQLDLLPPHLRPVAQAVILRRRAQRAAAVELGISLHTLRRRLLAVETLLRL